MISATGGVPVSIGGVSTHGHTDRLDPGDWDLSPAGGAEQVVAVATGVLSADPSVDDAITVDGESLVVLDHREVDDGTLVALVVGAWTHTASLYRPTSSGHRSRGQQQLDPGTPTATGVGCDIWPRDGEVEEREFGREATGQWEGRFPPGTDLEPGDWVKVTAGTGPELYEVTFVGEETDRWRTPVVLEESGEEAP